MPKTMKECIQTVEKQIELASIGMKTEMDVCSMYLEDDLTIAEKREIFDGLRGCVEAIEDLYEQLDDMREEARMMKEV